MIYALRLPGRPEPWSGFTTMLKTAIILLLGCSLSGVEPNRWDQDAVAVAQRAVQKVRYISDVDQNHAYITHKGGLVIKWMASSKFNFDLGAIGTNGTMTTQANNTCISVWPSTNDSKNAIAFVYLKVGDTWQFDDLWIEKIDGSAWGMNLSYIKENPNLATLRKKAANINEGDVDKVLKYLERILKIPLR